MPPTPDADTNDNGSDQPGTRPDTADSGNDALKKPDTGEAVGHPGRNATVPDPAATDAG